jgi:hypothetical protein
MLPTSRSCSSHADKCSLSDCTLVLNLVSVSAYACFCVCTAGCPSISGCLTACQKTTVPAALGDGCALSGLCVDGAECAVVLRKGVRPAAESIAARLAAQRHSLAGRSVDRQELSGACTWVGAVLYRFHIFSGKNRRCAIMHLAGWWEGVQDGGV